MKGQNANPFPWQLCFSEFVGTALLVLIGLSLVILMFGTGSPIIGIVPSEGLRRLITGFLFGTTGALIALSPVGKESGAHINPVVTLGFWLMHKLNTRTALGYVIAQLAGASAGVLPLLAWGSMGRSGVRCHFARRRLFLWNCLDGRSGHYLRPDLWIMRVSRVSKHSAIHTGNVSFSLCRDGVCGVSDIRYQHESCPQPRSGNPIRDLERMVDLLGWPADRYPRSNLCLRFPGEAHRSGKAVLFRHQSRSVASCRIVTTANGSDCYINKDENSMKSHST